MNMVTVEAPANLLVQTEAEFQRQVESAAAALGWKVIHIRNTIANPILPDLMLWRRERYLLWELKSERGKISPKQQEMIDEFDSWRVPIQVLRPSDWDWIIEQLEA